MSAVASSVVSLPVAPNVAAAFEEYSALVRAIDATPALATSIDHNIAIARAWRRWRDLFEQWDRIC